MPMTMPLIFYYCSPNKMPQDAALPPCFKANTDTRLVLMPPSQLRLIRMLLSIVRGGRTVIVDGVVPAQRLNPFPSVLEATYS